MKKAEAEAKAEENQKRKLKFKCIRKGEPDLSYLKNLNSMSQPGHLAATLSLLRKRLRARKYTPSYILNLEDIFVLYSRLKTLG